MIAILSFGRSVSGSLYGFLQNEYYILSVITHGNTYCRGGLCSIGNLVHHWHRRQVVNAASTGSLRVCRGQADLHRWSCRSFPSSHSTPSLWPKQEHILVDSSIMNRELNWQLATDAPVEYKKYNYWKLQGTAQYSWNFQLRPVISQAQPVHR